MEARQATDGDVRSLARTLARAFHDDPIMTWLFGERPGPRLRRLRRYFASEARRHGRHRQVLRSGDVAGVAFWDPPGSALVSPVLVRCDREGLGAYLESSKPANVPYYERFGSSVIGRIDLPSGPPVWPMWRDPE
jgi:hypothetical protein